MQRLNVKTINQALPAGATLFRMPGSFWRLVDAVSTVTVEFYKGGVSIGSADSLLPGLAVEGLDYDSFSVTPGTAGTTIFVFGDAYIKYDRGATTATVTSQVAVRATVVNSAPVVTTVASNLVGANSARNYLFIQNRSVSGTIYVRFNGPATVANGIEIGPGGSFQPLVAPISSVSAIGDIASNAEVIVLEG